MGGAAGHLIHPFEDSDLSAQDLKQMFDDIAHNRVNLYEKVDGYNLHVTMRGGTMLIARNKTTAIQPITIDMLTSMFKEAHVKQIFFDAAQDLERAFKKVFIADFDGFLNVEILDDRTCRLFDYGQVIQAHWISHFDEKGNIIRISDAEPLVKELQGEMYTIRGPNRMVVKTDALKPISFRSVQGSLKDFYRDTVFKDTRMKPFQDLGVETQEMIIDRWLNKTPNMTDIKKSMSPSQSKLFTNIDKHDRYKIMRKARQPLEIEVAEYGSYLLNNCHSTMSRSSQDRIQEKIQDVSSHLDELGSPEVRELFEKVNLENMTNYEGVVFEWKGKVYKMCGVYGICNQLLDELQRTRLAAEEAKNEERTNAGEKT